MKSWDRSRVLFMSRNNLSIPVLNYVVDEKQRRLTNWLHYAKQNWDVLTYTKHYIHGWNVCRRYLKWYPYRGNIMFDRINDRITVGGNYILTSVKDGIRIIRQQLFVLTNIESHNLKRSWPWKEPSTCHYPSFATLTGLNDTG